LRHAFNLAPAGSQFSIGGDGFLCGVLHASIVAAFERTREP
jgi:hypothetical protein